MQEYSIREFTEYLNSYLNKADKRGIVDLYTLAIEYMQAYNGRTRYDCLALSLGFEISEDMHGSTIYLKETGKNEQA